MITSVVGGDEVRRDAAEFLACLLVLPFRSGLGDDARAGTQPLAAVLLEDRAQHQACVERAVARHGRTAPAYRPRGLGSVRAMWSSAGL